MGLRQEYNEQLARWKKAFTYLSSDTPQEEKEKWLPEFEKICGRLNAIEIELRMQGIISTNERLMEGL